MKARAECPTATFCTDAVKLERAFFPIPQLFDPVFKACPHKCPTITLPEPDVISLRQSAPNDTFPVPTVKTGKELPKHKFGKLKSNVKVEDAPINCGVELSVSKSQLFNNGG